MTLHQSLDYTHQIAERALRSEQLRDDHAAAVDDVASRATDSPTRSTAVLYDALIRLTEDTAMRKVLAQMRIIDRNTKAVDDDAEALSIAADAFVDASYALADECQAYAEALA